LRFPVRRERNELRGYEWRFAVRPLKLEIEGFTAFREPVCLDFSQLDLFAITGPTGAGKSSLIDAICYALYGRIPRVSNEVTSCISQGLDRMLVGLEFMAGEERYRIFRETRRKGSPNVRLDRWREDGWQPLLDRAREVNEHVAEVVGLDYDGFTRSVLLPQGQFQEFLAGSAEKRRAVLASLLRLQVYESMRRRAAGMSAELKTRLDERQRALASYAGATPENVRRLEQELRDAAGQAEAMKGEIEELERAITLSGALVQAKERLARCETEAVASLAEFQKVSRVLEEGDEAMEHLESEKRAFQDQLHTNCYEPERHTSLSVAHERARMAGQVEAALEQATRQHNDAATQLAGAVAAVEKTAKAHQQAEAALAAADAARAEAQRHNLVAAIQHGLKPGDACPVCRGTIGELAAVDGADLAAAANRFESARKAESDARNSFATATNAGTRAGAALENAERQVEDLKTRLAAALQALAEVLPEGQEPLQTAIEAALREQATARTARQQLEAQLKDATEKAQALQRDLDQARHGMAALEQRARAAADALEAARQDVVKARNELEAASGEWPEITDAIRRDVSVVAALRQRHDDARSRQAALVRSMGQMEERIERLKADVERANELRESLAGLTQDHNVTADLAQMLGAPKFQTYVQQEAMLTLAACGSERLERLSAGRYKLQLDERGAEFEVVDLWNADQARSVRTLSGGETFLASLALSLALAESLPGLAASRRVVLDSIFLDEGFGSLDAEALDRAADALDALRLEDRMVCIVTHLPELAQRLPARVVVTKTEAGSSVAVA
jgi:DNA repair protein SbcC/Rad50